MSRRSSLDAIFSARPTVALGSPLEASNTDAAANGESLEASNKPPPVRVRSGAIAAMGGALEHLARRAQDAELIEEGAGIVELDPSTLDGSFVADRVTDANDPTQAALALSLRESGQQVPILVRPHPDRPGRYQIAYGHRRVRAAAANSMPVRAIVRSLNDDELVIAQGKENLDRRDLSYIERAYFALHLEEKGFSRAVICSAMAADKADISRYVTLARSVPERVVAAIGPAPKAGGPRWRALADRIAGVKTSRIEKILAEPELSTKPTDQRFVAVLDALTPNIGKPLKSSQKVWTDEQGRKLARIERSGQRFNLSIDEAIEPDFGEYLLSRLPEILAAHRASKD